MLDSDFDRDYSESEEGNCTDITYDCVPWNCPVIIKDYKYFIDGITLLIVAIFGIVGTIMSMIVLRKPKILGLLPKLFSKFLTSLCIFDCIFLIMVIPYIALPALSCW